MSGSLLPFPWQPLAPGGPSIPSRLRGVIAALMTLSAELLTPGIYGNQAQKHHLEAHKYCKTEAGLCQHYLGWDYSPETL